MIYPTRNDAFTPACRWELHSAAVTLHCADRSVRTLPLDRIAALRLSFDPTRSESNRYRCTLVLSGGESLTFFNRTFTGFANFEDTSAAYTAFVRELVAALANASPRCVFVGGVSASRYALNGLATAFVALVVLAATLFLLASGLIWIVVIKLVLLAVYFPNLVRWLRRNRPQPFVPSAIPPALLPL